jgi:hypothetical protein
MDRRAFLGRSTGGLLAAPLAAEAQQAAKVPGVGWMASFGEFRPSVREAIRELGYVEGKTVVF